MSNINDAIESLILVTHGASDLRTQHLFRQSLQELVALAKAEQRHEISMDLPSEARYVQRSTVH